MDMYKREDYIRVNGWRKIKGQNTFVQLSLKKTHVIKHILSTDVHQRSSKIAIGQLKRIIEAPQCSSERITDAGKTSAGCRVRLEHYQLFALTQRIGCGIEIRLDYNSARLMIEV